MICTIRLGYGGVDLKPRMEISAAGFSYTLVTICKNLLQPRIQEEVGYYDPETKLVPRSKKVLLSIVDVYRTYFYAPFARGMVFSSVQVKKIQSGNTNGYILYIFLALLATLIIAL